MLLLQKNKTEKLKRFRNIFIWWSCSRKDLCVFSFKLNTGGKVRVCRRWHGAGSAIQQDLQKFFFFSSSRVSNPTVGKLKSFYKVSYQAVFITDQFLHPHCPLFVLVTSLLTVLTLLYFLHIFLQTCIFIALSLLSSPSGGHLFAFLSNTHSRDSLDLLTSMPSSTDTQPQLWQALCPWIQCHGFQL